MGEGHKKLNISDCMGLAIGQIIGSGIMVLTGIVIGLTGHGIAAGVYFRPPCLPLSPVYRSSS